jgi:hypothetical protein
MYTPGQMQMQSAALLQGYAGDRPAFEAIVCRTFSAKPFQVFALPQGLLFLELRNKPGSGGGGNNNNAIVIGAVLGGMIGAGIAAALADANAAPADTENFDMCSEDELFALAQKRRRSFVSKADEIMSVTIDAPRGLSRLFANSSLAGYITIRDRKLGKVSMEIHDQAAMSVAVDALPRRFGERVFVNVEFDRHSTKFVPRGR